MLRDLLTSFPLSKVTRIDRRYLGQMRVMVKYCKKLNEQVKDLPSLHLAEDVIQSVTDVLSRAITKPSSKEEKARKLEVGGEFERCLKKIRSAVGSVCGAEEAESFDNDFGIERNQDSKSSENAEWRKDTLKEKLSILNNKPKRTIEFWVWEPYIPPMASEADQKYVSRRQLTFEEDMNFATALVYFLAELKKNPLSHWSGSVLESPLFYAKFPVTQAELSRKGGRIPALNILSTISDLVTGTLSLTQKFDLDIGKSSSKPLPIQVLADRKTCVFFESPVERRAIGNVFKISNSFILRDKGGDLLSTDALGVPFYNEDYNLKSQPQTFISRLKPNGQLMPAQNVGTLTRMFDKIVKTLRGNDTDHWWCKIGDGTSQNTSPSFSSNPSPWPWPPQSSHPLPSGPSSMKNVQQMPGSYVVPGAAEPAAMVKPIGMPEPIAAPPPLSFAIASRPPSPPPPPSNPPPASSIPSSSKSSYNPNFSTDSTPPSLPPDTPPLSRPSTPINRYPQRIGATRPMVQPAKDSTTVPTTMSSPPTVQGKYQNTTMSLRKALPSEPSPASSSLNHVFRPNISTPTTSPPKENSKGSLFSLSGIKKRFWG